jgi:uncharacterized protein
MNDATSPNASRSTEARPTAEAERIDSIDVLRGFALLGILIMNIQMFSMIFAAYFNPMAYGEVSGANRVVWLLSHVLADQKFMTIFSMLFGAGILIMTRRAEARTDRSAALHYRRMLWLILFGLLHAYLLWHGDILYAYGMCGLVVWLFRRLGPRWLIVLGLLSLAVSSAIFIFFGWSMQFWPEEALVDFVQDRQPPPEAVAAELEAFRGSWMDQMAYRVPYSLEFHLFVFFIWASWRAGGLMLIGMALHKLGLFDARRSASVYGWMIAVGLLVGIPIVLFGVQRNFAAGWDAGYSGFFGWQYNYWASLLVSLGWIGLVMLVCRRQAWRRWTRPLAAVGRTALSNYLLQTLLCTTLFYGHGFGLFGRLERTGQAAIVVAVWIVQLVVSPLWLHHFRFGPAEWLWRSLTYLELQPMRRRAAP